MRKIILATYFITMLLNSTSFSQSNEDEILWDSWGIPHIYATSDINLYKMMGWAQMRNHGDLILKLYGEARGKSSEYWEENLERDILLHQIGLVEAAKNSFEKLPAGDKAMIAAFVEGINTFANKYPDKIESKYKKVLPVTSEDVLLHTYRVFYLEFLINFQLYGVSNWSPGSNAWALSGAKTKSGNSILMANPHLLWRDFWLFFEAQLITEQNNLYGATLVGLPTIGIGFNESLGWTHTVNTLDNVDFYEITIQNEKYLIDDKWKSLKVDSSFVTQSVEGSKLQVPVLRKNTDYGAVLREFGDKALVIKWPNMKGDLNILGQWRKMGNSKSYTEFKKALEMNGLPLFNVIYSDDKNNIAYHFGGNVPKKIGEWDKWQRIVKTSSSKDLWDGIYAPNELPHYSNPKTGWIQNANDPPFTSTIPSVLQPADYTENITPNFMSFRAQRSAALIKDKTDLTIDDIAELKHDTKSELYLRLKDDLSRLQNQTQDSLTTEALSILILWDGSFDSSSEGSLLFMDFINELNNNSIFKKEWSFKNPLSTPDGFRDQKRVLESLNTAAVNQQKLYGTLSKPFGEVYRLKVGEFEYPANGGNEDYGIFRTVHSANWGNGKYYPYYGDTFVLVVEFGEEVKAKGLLAYGNATQSGSKHVGDQLRLFAEKKLRDIWLSRAEHEANLELKEKLKAMGSYF